MLMDGHGKGKKDQTSNIYKLRLMRKKYEHNTIFCLKLIFLKLIIMKTKIPHCRRYPPVTLNRSVKTFPYYSHSNWYLYQR